MMAEPVHVTLEDEPAQRTTSRRPTIHAAYDTAITLTIFDTVELTELAIQRLVPSNATDTGPPPVGKSVLTPVEGSILDTVSSSLLAIQT